MQRRLDYRGFQNVLTASQLRNVEDGLWLPFSPHFTLYIPWLLADAYQQVNEKQYPRLNYDILVSRLNLLLYVGGLNLDETFTISSHQNKIISVSLAPEENYTVVLESIQLFFQIILNCLGDSVDCHRFYNGHL